MKRAVTGAAVLSERALDRRRAILDADHAAFEIVPLKNLADQLQYLPDGALVSVTASPNKGLDVTLEICEQLVAAGHRPIPHLAARMVTGHDHLQQIVARCAAAGLDRAFIVGGDATEPGPYTDGEALLVDLLALDHPFTKIGVPAYPDGHAEISLDALHTALHRKQELLDAAGVEGWCSTQMCFDAAVIERWLASERSAGLTLPVFLGIAGAVDKAKLVTTGMRIGVGQSLRYLKKNRSSITKMMFQTAYDPDDLLLPLAESTPSLGIEGLHLFTFNQIEATNDWIDQARRSSS